MAEITYEFHEISSIFPLMEGEEFIALCDDIEMNGLLEGITLFEGKILDGRNRYRACKKLGETIKFRELPSYMDPLDFIISENLRRRHLNIAQRAEIGLLLLVEEEKKAKERLSKVAKELAESSKGTSRTKGEKLNKTQKDNFQRKIGKIKGKGSSVGIVAPIVKIGATTLSKAKKIKRVAEKDKDIAEKWEEAKKGKIGIDAVYKKVQEKEVIKNLPEDLDSRTIKQFTQIYKQVVISMTKRVVDSHNENTKTRLLRLMKGTLLHLQKELNVKKKVVKTSRLDFL